MMGMEGVPSLRTSGIPQLFRDKHYFSLFLRQKVRVGNCPKQGHTLVALLLVKAENWGAGANLLAAFKKSSLLLLLFVYFLAAVPACRIFVPQPWIQLCSLQWKHIVLTSDPPGKFLSLHLNTSSKETFIHCCGLEDEQLSPGKKLLTQKTFSAMSEIWELALVQP